MDFKYRNDFILILSFVGGIAVGFFPPLVFYWVLSVLILGVMSIVFSNKNAPVAYLFASYIAGIELLARMSDVPLFHEFAKYAVTLLLSIELLKFGKRVPWQIIAFGLLLIPGALIVEGSFEEVRTNLSANLSGPLCLIVATIYFYNRILRLKELKNIFLCLLNPLATMLGFMWVNTVDLSRIDFEQASNFTTSLYGPNQVSSILGVGILVIGLSFILKIRLFGTLTSVALFVMLLFRGLLTFSRGGMLAPLVVLAIIFIYLSWNTLWTAKMSFSRIASVLLALFVISYISFAYVDDLTGSALTARYTGENKRKEVTLDTYTSGRLLILMSDLRMFADHPVLGVGAGMGKSLRTQYGFPFDAAAHNEFSRLLAEHGLFGLVAMIFLIGFPVRRFNELNSIGEKCLLLALVSFCFVFMTHSATRIAVPSLFYGIAFIRISSPSRLARRLHRTQPRQKFEPAQLSMSVKPANTAS